MKKILALVLVLALSLGYLGALAEEVNWRALEGGELMVYGQRRGAWRCRGQGL